MTLDEESARVYLGALLAVCRADGDVNAGEMGALRAVANRIAEAARGETVDLEDLFFDHVTPAAFGAAFGPSSPFRSGGGNHDEVARTFVADATAVASGENELDALEHAAVKRFAAAIGVDAA